MALVHMTYPYTSKQITCRTFSTWSSHNPCSKSSTWTSFPTFRGSSSDLMHSHSALTTCRLMEELLFFEEISTNLASNSCPVGVGHRHNVIGCGMPSSAPKGNSLLPKQLSSICFLTAPVAWDKHVLWVRMVQSTFMRLLTGHRCWRGTSTPLKPLKGFFTVLVS